MKMKKESYKKLTVVGIFAVAMAFLESVIVVYLRELFYPEGFDFPLKGFIAPWVLNIEWTREFFTIVMLASVAFLAGKKFHEKFAYFLYSFAIWDIFYYIWLKVILNWPSSLVTWDLLFLIPLPWIGPVIAPIIASLTMIVFSVLIINFEDRGKKARIAIKEWMMFIIGVLIVLYTFLYDYSKLIFGGGFANEFFTLATNQKFINLISNFAPTSYMWKTFIFGEILVIMGIVMYYLRVEKR